MVRFVSNEVANVDSTDGPAVKIFNVKLNFTVFRKQHFSVI